MAVSPGLEIELDTNLVRAFEVADQYGIELTPELGALLRYSFCQGAQAATKNRGLWNRLVRMHEAGGVQELDRGV